MNGTPLGQQLAATKVAATPSPLSRYLAVAVRGMDVDIPGVGKAWIEILGETARQEVEAEVERAMKAREVTLSVTTEERFEGERALRTLARAVRDPAAHGSPYGSLEEWGLVPTATITSAWNCYSDVAEQLNPMAAPLTPEEFVAIESAVKKKAPVLLRSFGAVRLSAFLASTDVQLSTSPPPSSPPSDSPPA